MRFRTRFSTNFRPKINEKLTKNRRKIVEKTKLEKEDKKDMNFEPVLAIEREARCISRPSKHD